MAGLPAGVATSTPSASVVMATRVALDATPLLGRPTGVGVFCSGLLSALALRSDVEPAAFAVSWRRRGRLATALPPGVGWKQRPMPARPLHWAWRSTSGPPIEWFVGGAQVVHGTNFVVPPTARAAAVVTVHDLTTLRYPAMCDPSTLAFPELVRRAIRRGAFVHTPSRFVAAEVVELLGAHPDRVRAIHSGTPPLSVPQGGGSGRASGLALPEGAQRYVLAIGTAEPRKDLPGLVRAFGEVAARHPELALVLVGPDGWGSDQLAAAIAASPFGRRVVRTGWMDEARLAAVQRGAALLAYPSLYEGFGFPPLQAMSAGVPVVTTRAGALPEVVGDAAELVTPGDHEELAAAMVGVLDDEERRDRLIQSGAQRAAELTWERCGQGMAALYRQVASENQGRTGR